MEQVGPIYLPSDSGSLRQGEILTNVVQVLVVPGSDITDKTSVQIDIMKFPLAIVISQDCDLSSDYLNRQRLALEEDTAKQSKIRHKLLPNVLLCELENAYIQKDNFLNEPTLWERIVKNDDFRYHLLQKITKEEDRLQEGFDPLIVAFRRYFTVPTEDLLKRIESAETNRRCYMQSPYFEHVSDRFTHYTGRVGLPNDHDISGLKIKK